MAEKVKLSRGEFGTVKPAVSTLTVRDPRTGNAVVVRGAGALAGSGFKLKKGVSLLQPIAGQTLPRTAKFKVV